MSCVNITAGILNLDEVDFKFPGFIPFSFVRSYRATSTRSGMLGMGWSASLTEELVLRDDKLVLLNQEGREVPFELPSVGTPAINLADGLQAGATMDPQTRAVVFTLSDGNRTRYYRDMDGSRRYRIYRIEDAHGNALSYVYARGLVTEIIDTLGRRIGLQYDGGSRLVEVRLTAPIQQVLAQYTYDRAGYLVRVQKYTGAVNEYAYQDGLLVYYTDDQFVATYAAYDEARRCVKTWSPEGFYGRTYEYDHETYRTLATDAHGWSTLYRYDEFNLVREIIDPLGGVSRFHYDEGNNLALAVNQVGNATLMAYDEMGRLVSKTRADGSIEEFKYNEKGLLAEHVNAAGGVTTMTYTERGAPLKMTSPTGRTLQFEHDDRGATTAIIFPTGARIRRTYTIDEISYYYKDDLLLRQRYDVFGRCTELSYRGRYTLKYTYDARGKLVRKEGIGGAFRTYTYDNRGQRVKMVDERGAETTYQYNAVGLRTSTTTDGRRVQFSHDREGRLTRVENSQGEIHEIVYDRLGRTVSQTFFNGSSVDYAYDPAGARTLQRDSSGREIHFESDPLGRPTRLTFSDGSEVVMDYAPMGELAAGERDGVRVQFEYDEEGRVVLQRQDDYELHYQYNDFGALASVTDSDGRVRRYDYDEQMRLTQLSLNGNAPIADFRMEYDMLDVIQRLMLDERLVLQRSNNGWKRPVSQQILHAGQVLLEERYEYDARAQLQSYSGNGSDRARYLYDRHGLLQAVQAPGRDEDYQYDAQFNLIAKKTPLTGGATVAYQYGRGSRLEQGDGKRYTYDAAGRLVTVQDTSGTTRFEYTDDDLLKRVTLPDGRNAVYTYDALRRRARKVVREGETRFYWDQQTLWREVHTAHDSEDVLHTMDYIYDPHTWDVWAVVTDGEPYLAVNGPMGLPTAFYGRDGARVWHLQTTAWGEPIAEEGTKGLATATRFWGQYQDDETGLHYNINRYYDPRTARYTTPDPIGLLGGTNLYRYAPNPLNYADPYGLMCHNFPDGEPTTLFRGDSRPPSEICANGFERRNPNAGLTLFQHVEGVPSTGSNWISTSHTFEKAAGFGGSGSGPQYVYVIANPGCGQEVDCDPAVQAKYGDPPDAQSETEIAFNKDIPKGNVMGYQVMGPNGPGDFVSC